VSGFTALSERLDPEDVHQLMDRAFELMLAEVHRYEGTVNQFLGDGLMALFGAPIAHEDHAVRGVHAALNIQRALAGYREQLVRGRELALLQDRFAEVQAGRGQVVFVFGEPGVGKSRLLLEFRRHVEAAGARWLTGRCVSYSRTTSYLAIADLVRNLLGIQEADGVEAIIGKIAAGVAGLGGGLDRAVPFVRAMLSIDPGDAEAAAMPPHQRRGRIVQAVTALLLRLSERSPLALAVEDLHWIDPQSEEVLRALVEGIAATPVLVLLTHRPGYTPPFQDQTYVSRITLRGLSAAQAVGLVGSVLRADSVPAAAVELITRRAEGNPLFVEELSRALLEDGTLQRDN